MAENEKQEVKEQEEAKDLVPRFISTPLTEEQKQEEQQIERWYYRMERYPVPLPDKVRYMAARMAVAYGLDPFLGEMVFIEQWKNKKLVGYAPYVGIGGLRRAARRTGEYGGRKLRPCTDEERKALQVDDEDTHAWYCQVWRKGIEHAFDGFGIFPMNDKDRSQAPPWRMARKRAEHAALRAAFDLELQLMEANGMVVGEVTELPGEEPLGSFAPPQQEEPPPPMAEEVAELPDESLEEAVEEAKAMLDEAERKAEEIIQKGLEKQDEPLDLKAAITTGHTEETPTAEQVIEEASEGLEEILAEAKEEEETKQKQGAEGLWAYAEAKGIDIGIVKTVLEETGGEVEETLARLKEKYGEVEDA